MLLELPVAERYPPGLPPEDCQVGTAPPTPVQPSLEESNQLLTSAGTGVMIARVASDQARGAAITPSRSETATAAARAGTRDGSAASARWLRDRRGGVQSLMAVFLSRRSGSRSAREGACSAEGGARSGAGIPGGAGDGPAHHERFGTHVPLVNRQNRF